MNERQGMWRIRRIFVVFVLMLGLGQVPEQMKSVSVQALSLPASSDVALSDHQFTDGLSVTGSVFSAAEEFSLENISALKATGVTITTQNPAAAYCIDIMGYDYSVINDDHGGQVGTCKMPNGQICDQWEFYAGICGSGYSYCAENGYRTETRYDGNDPFAVKYAVCVNSKQQDLGSVVSLSGLARLIDKRSEGHLNESLTLIHQTVPSTVTLNSPASFDWRTYQGYNWLTAVKNQGACGSCWAFATIGVIESFYNIAMSNPNLNLNLAEQDLVRCSGAGSCSGGNSDSAFQYIQSTGVVDEVCYPYTASDGVCSRCADWQNRLTKIDSYQGVSPSLSALKDAMVSYGPLVVYMGILSTYGGYFDNNDVYRCSNDSQNGNYGINHAVVFVGYDDAGGYWIVRNSWGSNWNGDGYFKVGYGECNTDQYSATYVYAQPPFTAYSLSATSGANGWYMSPVAVTFTTDKPVAWTRYRVDGGPWVTYYSPFTVNYDGIHGIEFYSRGLLGGEETIRAITVKVDTTAPTVPSSVNPGCTATYGVWQNTCSDANFTWGGANDATSGVAGYEIYWGSEPNGTGGTLWSASAAYNPGAIGSGAVYLKTRTKDNAGNWSRWVTLFLLRYDGVAPTGSLKINNQAAVTNATSVRLQTSAVDATSGLCQMRFRDSGAAWSGWCNYAGSTFWQLPGPTGRDFTVETQFKDCAGNISGTYADAITLDIYPERPATSRYGIVKSTFGASGTNSTSDNYGLHATLGQPSMIGQMSSAEYILASGYWAMHYENFAVYLPLVLRQS